METDSAFISALFGVTFLIAIGVGGWQYLKTVKARREGHRSADGAR